MRGAEEETGEMRDRERRRRFGVCLVVFLSSPTSHFLFRGGLFPKLTSSSSTHSFLERFHGQGTDNHHLSKSHTSLAEAAGPSSDALPTLRLLPPTAQHTTGTSPPQLKRHLTRQPPANGRSLSQEAADKMPCLGCLIKNWHLLLSSGGWQVQD